MTVAFIQATSGPPREKGMAHGRRPGAARNAFHIATAGFNLKRVRSSALAACLGNGPIAGGAPIAMATCVVMHITGTNISAALKRHAERSLRTMLGEELKRVVAIDVELSGEDRRHTTDRNVCAIRAVLQRAGVVFVHGRSTDAATAVDRAGSRLKTALATWPASRTYGRFDSAS